MKSHPIPRFSGRNTLEALSLAQFQVPQQQKKPWPIWKKALAITGAVAAAGVLLQWRGASDPCNPAFDSQCSGPYEQPIISARLVRGLGNQMFQVATAYALAEDIGGKAMFPEATVAHVGNSPVLSKLERFQGAKPPNSETIVERTAHFLNLPKDRRHSLHLDGQFLSAKYFDHHRKEILELFAPSPETKAHLQSKYGDLLKQNTVAVHVRKGDYETFRYNNERILCDLTEDTNYYENAIKHFNKEDCHFVVFSDDIDFAKNMPEFKNLKVTFIEGQQSHEDLYLMSMCKHQIMANSTFSWWATYLRENPNQKVTYPMNAYFGPAVAKMASREDSFWSPRLPPSAFDSKGKCCKGPDYFPMAHWIKVT